MDQSEEFEDIEIIRTQYDFIDPLSSTEDEILSRLKDSKYLSTILYQAKDKFPRELPQDDEFEPIRVRNMMVALNGAIIPVLGQDGAICRLPYATHAIDEGGVLVALSSETQFNATKFAIDEEKIKSCLLEALGVHHVSNIQIECPGITPENHEVFQKKYNIVDFEQLAELEGQIQFLLRNIKLSILPPKLIPEQKPNQTVVIKPWQTPSYYNEITKLIGELNKTGFMSYRICPDAPSISAVIEITHAGEIQGMLDEVSKNKVIQESTEKSHKNENLKKFYLILIEEIFGNKKIGEIKKSLKEIPSYGIDDIIKLLTPNELKLVENEAQNRKAVWKHLSTNTCDHIKILRRFRFARTQEQAKEALEDLNAYIDEKAKKEWIECTACGLRLMCPHELMHRRMQLQGKSSTDIRANLLDFSVNVIKYRSKFHYCSICSELLVEKNEDKTINAELTNERSKKLKSRTWSVLQTIVKHIKFKMLTDEKKFVIVGTNYLFPHIVAEGIQAVTRRKKTIEEQEGLDPRDILLVISFVYAYTLALSGSGDISFEGVRPDSPASAYMGVMIKLINKNHGSSLSMMEDLSSDYIKEQIKVAFRKIKGIEKLSLKQPNPEQEMVIFIKDDPIYSYAKWAYKVDSKNSNDQPEFKDVMSREPSDINKAAKAIMKDPVMSKVIIKRVGLEVPPMGTYNEHMMNPKINIYSKIFIAKNKNNIKSLDSYNIFARYVSTGEPMYMPLDDMIGEYQRAIKRQVPTSYHKAKNTLAPHLKIRRGLIMDENRVKHQWSTYICKSADGKITENSSVRDFPLGSVVVDTKCIHCARLQSSLNKAELDKIESELTKSDKKTIQKDIKTVKAANKFTEFIKKDGQKEVKWTSDFSVVVKLAEMVRHPQVIIEAIGDIEGRDFDDIVSGSVMSSEITNKSDPRVLNTLAEMRTFRKAYTQAKLPKLEIFNSDEFSMLEPKQMRPYIIQKMCSWAISVPKNEKATIREIFDDIIAGQRRLSKPNSFNWRVNETDIDAEDFADFD